MTTPAFQVKHPLWALLLALLGLIWCAYLAFPTGGSQACVTSGCALFRDFSIAGFSLWWVGVGYFFVLALLCLRGYHLAAWFLARFALFLDTLLLIIMLFSAPCFDCLVIAVFFALTLLCLRPAPHAWFTGKPVRLLVLPLWAGLFLSNAALAANEMMPLWNIDQHNSTSIRIFFSPSCPHCRDALITLGANATLIPVAEKETDTTQILQLAALLKEGLSPQEALDRITNKQTAFTSVSPIVRAFRWVQLMRNKAVIFKMGYSSLPVIIINGMPQQFSSSAAEKTRPSGTAVTKAVNEATLWGEGTFGTCGQETNATCE